jgi:hypothetical protein
MHGRKAQHWLRERLLVAHEAFILASMTPCGNVSWLSGLRIPESH